MPSFSSFIDQSLPLWRKYRLEDWKNISLASMILTTGCVLAAMSWKLGASLIFVLLYILLGTTGFLVEYSKVYRGMPRKSSETLPLLSPSRFKLVSQESKPIDKNSEISMSDSVLKTNENSDPGSNFCSSDTSQNQSVRSSRIERCSGDVIRIFKGVEVNDNPRLTHEVYVTGPLPRSNQSRQTENDGQSGSWQRLLQITNVFRTSPTTVPSAQFHISLEVSDSQQETESSKPEENPLVPLFRSSVPHQPIYQNIIPHPERRRVFSENDLIKLFDYDIPSKELRAVGNNGGQDEILPSCERRNIQSSELKGKGSRSRLGDFTSPKRTYVNVVFPFNQKLNDISQHLGEQQPEQTENYSPTTQLEHSSCKISPSKDSESSGKYHLDKQDSLITNRDIQNIELHNFLLQDENSYVNVSSLCQNTENHPDENSLSRSKTCEASSSEAEEASIPENVCVYLPSPLSRMISTIKNDTMLHKIQIDASSEVEYSADSETQNSKSEKFAEDKSTCQNQTWVGSRFENKARSERMCAFDFSPSLKASVETGPNVQSEIDTFGMKIADDVSTLEIDNPSSARTKQCENLLYGSSIYQNENKFMEVRNEKDNFINIEEKEYKLAVEDPSMFQKGDSGIKMSSNSQNRGSLVNQTFLTDSNAYSSCPNTLLKNIRNLQTLSEITENQATSKQFSVITNLEDEDSFCLSKKLAGGKTSKIENSQITTVTSGSSNKCKTRSSISSEHSRSLLSTETGILRSNDLGNIFPPIKHTRSFTKEIPSTSMVSCTSRRASFNTPLEIPRSKTFRSPEFRTTPLILPPLDNGYSSKTRSSERHSTSTEKVDLPVILNRSSTVQTQLKRFSALSQESVQSINHLASHFPHKTFRHSEQSSSMLLNSKSQIESLETRCSIPPTTQGSDRGCSLIPPSKFNLSTRHFEESSNISPISSTINLPLNTTFPETRTSLKYQGGSLLTSLAGTSAKQNPEQDCNLTPQSNWKLCRRNFEQSSKNSVLSTITPIDESDTVICPESTPPAPVSNSESPLEFFTTTKHSPVYF